MTRLGNGGAPRGCAKAILCGSRVKLGGEDREPLFFNVDDFYGCDEGKSLGNGKV
jgi:hypothetical protein